MIDITLDFETYFGTGYSLSLQKYNTPRYVRDPQFKVHCVGIKVDNGPVRVFDHENFEAWAMEIPWSDVRLICHNLNFDGFILKDVFGIQPGRYFCTQEAGMAVFQNEVRNGLTDIAQRCGFRSKLEGLEDTRNKRDLAPDEYTRLAIYCANDVDLTYEVFKFLSATLPPREQDILSLTKKQWCRPVLRLDRDMIADELREQIEHRQTVVAKTGLAEGNFTSPAKFAQVLEKRGVQPPLKWSEKQKKEVPAFAKDDLPWLQMIDEWRRTGQNDLVNLAEARMTCASNIAITRAERMLELAESGRPMGAPYRYWGAHTGRFSGAEQINLQNFKRKSKLREAIMAPPGYVLVVLDLSQIELRMNAYTAGEQQILEDLRSGICVYSRSAGQIYNDPDWMLFKAMADERPEYGVKRFVGKITQLGLGYGMGPPKFQHTLAIGAMGPPVFISDDEARNIVYNVYRPNHPNIVAQWDLFNHMLGEMLRTDCDIDYKGILRFRHNHVAMPNGMYLYYPHLRYDEQERGFVYWDAVKGYWKKIYGGLFDENIVQALSRIVMTDAMLIIDERYPVVMHTHDELIALAPESEAQQCYDFMEATLTTPPSWAPDIPLQAEGGWDVRYTK